jgi:hypothetical protein
MSANEIRFFPRRFILCFGFPALSSFENGPAVRIKTSFVAFQATGDRRVIWNKLFAQAEDIRFARPTLCKGALFRTSWSANHN